MKVPPKHKEHLFTLSATVVYFLLTLLVTHPIPFRLSSVIAGGPPFDALQYTWSLWWVKEAIFTLHTSPANLLLLHHPAGTTLPFLFAIPYIYFVGIPLSTFLSPPAVYNVQLLASFVLSGLTMYLLCRELGIDRRAAFVGGLIYGFFPSRIAHATAGHLPHVTTYWFPLYALFLVRVVRAPTLRNSLLCGGSLGISLLVHVMHIPYLLLPLTVVYLVYEFAIVRRSWPNRHTIKALSLAFVVGGIIALPWFVPLIIATLQGQTAHMRSGGTLSFSADLLSFIAPSPYNPVLQNLGLVPSLSHQIVPNFLVLNESLGYLGLLALALGVWGAWQRRREVGSWVIVALGAALFSLGPLLQVGGQLVSLAQNRLQTFIPLPYALVTELPFMEWGRTPNRLNATIVFALAVLAAYGLADLLGRTPRRRGFVLTAVLVPLIVAESIPLWPFPTLSTDAPTYLHTLSNDVSQSGVLSLPMTTRRINHYSLFYQTTHHHPIVGGYVHRELPSIPGLLPFLEDVTLVPPPVDVISRPDPTVIRPLLQAYDIGYVFLFEDAFVDPIPNRQFLSAALESPAAVEYEVSLFQVSPEATEVENLVYGLDRESWHPVETWADAPARWMPEYADLYIYSPEAQEGVLHFTAMPILSTQRLQIEVNDTPLTPLLIGDWMTYTTPLFALEPGLNRIALQADGGCTTFVGDPRCAGPARTAGASCDSYLREERCLSVLFQNIHFLPATAGPAEHPLDVVLGERVRFVGYNIEEPVEPGHTFPLTLYWQALGHIEEDYVIFVHLLGPDGELLVQHDSPPLGGTYPTSAWVEGDLFFHQVVLTIPADAPPGQYDLLVGMYTYPEIARLPVASDRPYAQDGLIWLQHVDIEP